MADFGVAETIAIIGAVAAAGTAAGTGIADAKASSDAADDKRNAAAISEAQLKEQAQVERTKRIMEAERVKGRLRVLAAASGFGSKDGSYENLLTNADLEEGLNLKLLDTNLQNQLNRVRSGAAADLNALRNAGNGAIIGSTAGAFSSGLSGYSSGLQIGRSIQGS